MLAHRVVSFCALAALLALYSGIHHDAFKTVAIPTYVVYMNFSYLLLICAVFLIMRSSIFTSSVDVGFDLMDEFCAPVRLVVL